jgi:mono/diheme cytochrome c family protein
LRFILLLLPIFLLSNENNETESFLSDIEYGEMLYNNPRGIPCSKCHGEKGKGGHKIAKYYDKNSNPRILKGEDITKYTLKELEASLENRFIDKNNRRVRHKIMPIYYLTSDEVRAIYLYLKSVKKK